MKYQTVPLTRPVSWSGFILHVLENCPSLIFDRAERDAWAAKYWAANPRLDGQQWRRGGSHAATTERTAA